MAEFPRPVLSDGLSTVSVMPPLPRPTGQDLVRAMSRLGWVVVAHRGSHAQLKHPDRGGRVTEPEPDGGYFVTVPALPGCFTRGRTIEECRRRAIEAIETHIAGLQADGEPVQDLGIGISFAGLPDTSRYWTHTASRGKKSAPQTQA